MLVLVSRIKAPAMTITKGSPSSQLARARVSTFVSLINKIYLLRVGVPRLPLDPLMLFFTSKWLLYNSSLITSSELSLLTRKGFPSSVNL